MKFEVPDELKRSSGIYKISLIDDGTFYVGSAVNLFKRFKEHSRTLRNGSHHCDHLNNAVKKYGLDKALFSLIEICDRDVLIEREQYWFSQFDRLYNTCKVAGSTLGRVMSVGQKVHLSKLKTGSTLSESCKKNISESLKGKILSDETRKKVGAAKFGKAKSTNVSGVAGVVKKKDKWVARAFVNGKDKHIGTFSTFEDAVSARQSFVKEIR